MKCTSCNILLILFQLLLPLLAYTQVEKGTFIFDGHADYFHSEGISFSQIKKIETISNTLTLGYFFSDKYCGGAHLDFLHSNSFTFNTNTAASTQFNTTNIQLNPFLRHYFINQKLGIFGQIEFPTHLNQSPSSTLTENNWDFSFSSYIGLGAHLFIKKNIALELSISRFLFRTGNAFTGNNLILNIGSIRNFQFPYQVKMPNLESKYLFVRNIYLELTLSQIFSFESRNLSNFALGIGSFIGDKWMIGVNFKHNSVNITNTSFANNQIKAETQYFFRINTKGWYIVPVLGFINNSNVFRFSVNSLGTPFRNSQEVYGSIEVTKFIGSRLIVGLGLQYTESFKQDVDNHQLISGVFKSTFFINEEVALEAKITPYLWDKFSENEVFENDSHLINSYQISVKNFIFMK